MSSSKMPIEKVIEDVSLMGFTKDEVRTVVRELTKQGKTVDLNVVLDKLMKGEGSKKGWFGR